MNTARALTRLPTLSTRSAGTTPAIAALKNLLETQITQADVCQQFARLVVEFGPKKVETDAQRRLLEREWYEAFSAFSPKLLHAAVSACIETCDYWPRIKEVRQHLLRLRGEAFTKWAVATGYGRYRAEDQSDPPKDPPEVRARVSAMYKEWCGRFDAAGGEPLSSGRGMKSGGALVRAAMGNIVDGNLSEPLEVDEVPNE